MPRPLPFSLKSRRRRGIALVYTSLALVSLVMVGALSVDLGILYVKRAEMQRAADAAALAGAWHMAHPDLSKTSTAQKADAIYQAKLFAWKPENGGFSDGYQGTKVEVIQPARDENGVVQDNWIRVNISSPESTFLARMFTNRNTVGVGVSATALYEILAEFSIKGQGTYGVAPGPTNLAVFGPNAQYNNGDCYSTKLLADKKTPNPDYRATGYDFVVRVPDALKTQSLSFEIFDPDCYNLGDDPNAGKVNNVVARIDEYRNSDGGASTPTTSSRQGTIQNFTTTKYSLYYDNGTADTSDDKLIASRDYGYDSSTDMKWVESFRFTPSNSFQSGKPQGQFRLNVRTTAGSSENGFDLRLGKVRSGSQAFDSNNGTKITAEGNLPINFNQGGSSVQINLGRIPVGAAGGKLKIRKFDTDVEPETITYTCDTLPTFKEYGVLSNNGEFKTDELTIPTNYTTEGNWYATYRAGTGDTSVWDMSFTNSGPGRPGGIRLIR